MIVHLTGAPLGRALNSLSRAHMHVYSRDRCARMRAFHRIARACGPTPQTNSPNYPCMTPHTYPAQKLEAYFYAGRSDY
jgi:hypothetical protein